MSQSGSLLNKKIFKPCILNCHLCWAQEIRLFIVATLFSLEVDWTIYLLEWGPYLVFTGLWGCRWSDVFAPQKAMFERNALSLKIGLCDSERKRVWLVGSHASFQNLRSCLWMLILEARGHRCELLTCEGIRLVYPAVSWSWGRQERVFMASLF